MTTATSTDFVDELDEDFKSIEKDDESKATYVFDGSGHMRLIVENLERMRQNDVLLDLQINNQEGTCHEFHSPLMAAASSHFRQFFSDSQIHFHSGCLDLRDRVDSSTLMALRQYLYEPEKMFEVPDWTRLMEFSSGFGFFKMVNGKGEFENYLSNLKEMKDKCQMTFTVLQTFDDTQFLCHGCIVAACSPYLCQKLWEENLPANSGRLNLILPAEIRSKGIAPILSYIYEAKLTVSLENADAVLAASCFLRCPSVMKACVDFMKKRMSPSNVISYETMTRDLMKRRNWKSLHQLNQMTKQWVCANIEKVLTSAAFALHLTEDDILGYLAASDITKLTLEAVLSALLRWRAAAPGRDRPFARLVTIACHLLDKEGLSRAFALFQQFQGNVNGISRLNTPSNSTAPNPNKPATENPTSSMQPNQTTLAAQNADRSTKANQTSFIAPNPSTAQHTHNIFSFQNPNNIGNVRPGNPTNPNPS